MKHNMVWAWKYEHFDGEKWLQILSNTLPFMAGIRNLEPVFQKPGYKPDLLADLEVVISDYLSEKYPPGNAEQGEMMSTVIEAVDKLKSTLRSKA